jgi:tRNA pseudouridine55 synthase
MDGLLVVDKPAGPTSHDVVARVRRALGERRIGHTGTLDPAASGVLALVLGRATRLARFLSAADKAYLAVVRFGVATDTYDADGTAVGARFAGTLPSREAVAAALDEFRGSYLQQPPAYSAKKVDGRRSYARAREASRTLPVQTHPLPAPAPVTAYRVELVTMGGELATLHVECSAGFYVRALAHDLGARLGCGAHLASLRRSRSGDVTVDGALSLDAIERDPTAAAAVVVPMSRMLPGLAAVTLTGEGVNRALHGRDLGPADTEKGVGSLFPDDAKKTPDPFFVRLIAPDGELVAIAAPKTGSALLHPLVVLM